MPSGFTPLNSVLRLGRIPLSWTSTKTPCTEMNQAVSRLHPLERSYIAAATSKRQSEFVIGRQCARQALSRLGVGVEVIARDDKRAPIWPANVTGSISHSERICGAVVALREHYRGVGLDIERRKILKTATAEYICNPDELEYLSRHQQEDLAVFIFSAKEAVYKCIAQSEGQQLTFRDVSIRIEDDTTFRVIFHRHDFSSRDIRGYYHLGHDYVYALVTVGVEPS